MRFWDWNIVEAPTLFSFHRNPLFSFNIFNNLQITAANRNMKPFLPFPNLESVKLLRTKTFYTVHADKLCQMSSRRANHVVNKIRD